MCVGFMRSIAAVLVFVQVHITGPSSQAISRCSNVSVAPHLMQDVVVVRWIRTHDLSRRAALDRAATGTGNTH